jgi:hypothetical protein
MTSTTRWSGMGRVGTWPLHWEARYASQNFPFAPLLLSSSLHLPIHFRMANWTYSPTGRDHQLPPMREHECPFIYPAITICLFSRLATVIASPDLCHGLSAFNSPNPHSRTPTCSVRMYSVRLFTFTSVSAINRSIQLYPASGLPLAPTTHPHHSHQSQPLAWIPDSQQRAATKDIQRSYNEAAQSKGECGTGHYRDPRSERTRMIWRLYLIQCDPLPTFYMQAYSVAENFSG